MLPKLLKARIFDIKIYIMESSKYAYNLRIIFKKKRD